MKRAAAPRGLLGDLDARTASRLLGASSDIALVLDGTGKVVEVVIHDADLAKTYAAAWRGKAWIDTVTVESRDKIAALLRDAGTDAAAPRWRQVNHPSRTGDDLPVLYSAVRVADDGRSPATGRIAVFGRDLRATVTLQKRLVEAQQAMERDYWRFREAETRYRNLFQTASEAVLIVEAPSLKVVEANPAAEALWGRSRTRLAGAALLSLFDPVGAEALQALLAATRMVGQRDAVRVALADGQTHVAASATAFRQDDAAYLLVRLVPWRVEAMPLPVAGRGGRREPMRTAPPVLEGWADHLPDAIAFTDAQGRVVSVNRAFVTLAQLTHAEQARGRMLDQWLGSTGVELSVLIGNLRQRGSVGLFATTLRGEFGARSEVEIAASTLPPESGAAIAFAVRDVARRLSGPDRAAPRLPRSEHEMTELVGRVPLKQIVSETTDLIEELCIETALQMTGDNRASAAQLLGLSRQSLYVKLRRFGLGEAGSDEG